MVNIYQAPQEETFDIERPRIALIDGDLWSYDIAFAAQPKDKEMYSFRFCRDTIETRLEEVLQVTGCSSYEFYLTGKDNFRDKIVADAVYKGGRDHGERPHYYEEIRWYLSGRHKAITVNGMEADDMCCIRQRELGTAGIIVSRDKDLRQMKGWHYSYRCGLQPAIGPFYTDEIGFLFPPVKNKLFGAGKKFFYAQLLLGDTADNIKGVDGYGPVKTYKLLNPLETEQSLYSTVRSLYRECEIPDEVFIARANLLWMVREMKDNQPVLWRPPDDNA